MADKPSDGINESGGGIEGAIDPAGIEASSGDDNGNGGSDSGNESDGIRRNKDGSISKPRGRKAGSGNRASAGANDLKASIDQLSSILVILHAGIAGATNTPELELDKKEGDLLAGAAIPVLDIFDIKPDPRVTAVIGLVMASAQIYGPRIYLIRDRKQKEFEVEMNPVSPVYI